MREKKWLRVPSVNGDVLYQISKWTQPVSLETPPVCPCCNEQLGAAFDVVQWGMFEDSYLTYLVCPGCVRAFELRYSVPTYAIVSRRAQRELGFLPSKKIQPQAGSDQRER